LLVIGGSFCMLNLTVATVGQTFTIVKKEAESKRAIKGQVALLRVSVSEWATEKKGRWWAITFAQTVTRECADAEEAQRRKIQAERDEMKALAEQDKDDDDDDDGDDEQPLLFDQTFALKLWLTGSPFSLLLTFSVAVSSQSPSCSQSVLLLCSAQTQLWCLIFAALPLSNGWPAFQALDLMHGASNIFQGLAKRPMGI